MKYIILSPDGFAIDAEATYKNKAEARRAFTKWIGNYKTQGYYSTIKNGERLKIPIDELESYCELKAI